MSATEEFESKDVNVINNYPLLSIIVPVYNVEQFLDRCVKSIVEQTYTNLEIILVDDKSPDSCPEKCDDWASRDSRIKVLHLENNSGPAVSRNLALDCAKGEYIGFVDSDDWIAEDMYMSMYHNLINSDADIAYTACYHAYDDGTTSKKHLVENVHLVISNSEAFRYINLPGYFGPAPWDKLLKKETIGSARFPENAKRNDDYAFAFETLGNARTIVYDSQPKYYYRMVKNSISNTKVTTDMEVFEQMVDMVRARFPEQLPFALYGQLLAMLGMYDQIISSKTINPHEYDAFKKKISIFLSENYDFIINNVPLSRNREMQIRLFNISPTIYSKSFHVYKVFRPWRSA